MSTPARACRICGDRSDHPAWPAREMQFGMRETFTYFECQACGCVQIDEIPADLGRYYPSGYFSFRPWTKLSRDPVRRVVDPHRVRNAFGGDALGALVETVSKPLDYVDWVKRAGLGPSASVLDVGCGAGKTLVTMALGGFSPCVGVDPFIEQDLAYENGVEVRKLSLAQYAERRERLFDLIMFHHSLEHVLDPLADLRAAAGLLAPGGAIQVEVPVAGWAWEHYRGDWCDLDAPRHLHILTPRSMALLAGQAGLRVVETICNSNWGQFIGSERNRRDMAAVENRNPKALFSKAQLADFKRRTAELNAEGRGDRMAFYLKAA